MGGTSVEENFPRILSQSCSLILGLWNQPTRPENHLRLVEGWGNPCRGCTPPPWFNVTTVWAMLPEISPGWCCPQESLKRDPHFSWEGVPNTPLLGKLHKARCGGGWCIAPSNMGLPTPQCETWSPQAAPQLHHYRIIWNIRSFAYGIFLRFIFLMFK